MKAKSKNWLDELRDRRLNAPVKGGWSSFPWDDPELSRQVLKLHLDSSNDQASRPYDLIVAECAFLDGIFRDALGRPARVCDLTCGPGFYAVELTRLGHAATGVDFSPAAIAYAREQAASLGLPIDYREADARAVDFPDQSFEAVTLLYAQGNAFRPDEFQRVLEKIRRWIADDGVLVLDLITRNALREDVGRTWKIKESSAFHEGRQLWLEERRYLPEQRKQVHQVFILDQHGKLVREFAICHAAYSPAELESLLQETGWRLETVFGDLTGREYQAEDAEWLVAVARPAGDPARRRPLTD